jgi:hypothetical protein
MPYFEKKSKNLQNAPVVVEWKKFSYFDTYITFVKPVRGTCGLWRWVAMVCSR